MPRVDFYILSDQSSDNRSVLTCRLSEKAYSLGHKVYIHCASPEQARALDDLLWSFRQGSFVPHALWPVGDEDRSPVLIGAGDELPQREMDVLINLGAPPPADFERFERVVEVVDQQPDILAVSREHFRFYRERGYPPDSHKL